MTLYRHEVASALFLQGRATGNTALIDLSGSVRSGEWDPNLRDAIAYGDHLIKEDDATTPAWSALRDRP